MKEAGALVIDADGIVHHLLASDSECIEKVVALLGQEVKSHDHINRKAVARIVFSNRDKLTALEKILHPRVFETIEKTYDEEKLLSNYKYFVVECPLLFEAGWESFFDLSVLVTAPRDICFERFIEKGFDPKQFELRQNRQLSTQKKETRCQVIIRNDKTKNELKDQVQKLLASL